MLFDENDDPVYTLGVDFEIGDRVYALCEGMGIAGVLVAVMADNAVVDFGGTYGLKETPLSSVMPYDLT